MTRCLKFELLWRDVDILSIRISASNGNFSAAAHVYEGTGGAAELATQFQSFPASSHDTRDFMVGSFGRDSAGGSVRMRLFSEGGAVRAFIELWFESDYQESGRDESAHFFSAVEPGAIDTFVAQLQQIERGEGDGAELLLV
jgi:hypothetical protein